jgi:pyruvate kinase
VLQLDADFAGKTFTRIDQAIAMGALFTAHHLGAKAIVALTDSGSTALWMSRHLIKVPIYALTSKVATQRKMTLYRNVRPLLIDTSADRDTALAQAEIDLKKRHIVRLVAPTCSRYAELPELGTPCIRIARRGLVFA